MFEKEKMSTGLQEKITECDKLFTRLMRTEDETERDALATLYKDKQDKLNELLKKVVE